VEAKTAKLWIFRAGKAGFDQVDSTFVEAQLVTESRRAARRMRIRCRSREACFRFHHVTCAALAQLARDEGHIPACPTHAA
jgi:hypothetical protein